MNVAILVTLVKVWTNKEVVSEVGRVPVTRGCGPREVGSVVGPYRNCGKILLPLPLHIREWRDSTAKGPSREVAVSAVTCPGVKDVHREPHLQRKDQCLWMKMKGRLLETEDGGP